MGRTTSSHISPSIRALTTHLVSAVTDTAKNWVCKHLCKTLVLFFLVLQYKYQFIDTFALFIFLDSTHKEFHVIFLRLISLNMILFSSRYTQIWGCLCTCFLRGIIPGCGNDTSRMIPWKSRIAALLIREHTFSVTQLKLFPCLKGDTWLSSACCSVAFITKAALSSLSSANYRQGSWISSNGPNEFRTQEFKL